MKLGIFMGSFNPPHKGHLSIMNYLLNNNYVDKILVVPTLNYWDKNNLVDIKHRINMLKFYENEKIMIDIDHNKYIYTIDLINEIKKLYPSDELIIIMGADNIIDLDKWKNYQDLLKYNIIIMNRSDIDISKYTSKYNGNFTIINDFNIPISSTITRNNLSSEYLDNNILKYIEENNLY